MGDYSNCHRNAVYTLVSLWGKHQQVVCSRILVRRWQSSRIAPSSGSRPYGELLLFFPHHCEIIFIYSRYLGAAGALQ